jgi:hypothetical protein
MPVATSTLCMASQVQGSTLIEFEAHVTNAPDMPARTRTIGFINCAHFADHFMLLVYATAVITMAPEFGLSYGAGIALSTGLFACFGCSRCPPAGSPTAGADATCWRCSGSAAEAA